MTRGQICSRDFQSIISASVVTFPLLHRQVVVLKRLVVRQGDGLVGGVSVLSQVGMGQSLLSRDPLVSVQLQHPLEQVDGWKKANAGS